MGAPSERKRVLVSLLSMVLGTCGVLGLLLAMNAQTLEPPKHAALGPTSFDVQAPPKPPPAQKKRSAPPRQQRSAKAPPPMPLLAVGLSGVDFGLPTFDDAALGALGDALLGNMENVVMTADAVDDPPRPITQTAAPYPPRARQRGIEGFVTLSLLIGPGGEVSDVKVLEASPAGVFEDAALMTIRQWRFKPGTYQGEPVTVRVRQTLKFELS